MVIIKLSGGLGNQLFQYAFGRCIGLKYNFRVVFDPQFKSSNSSFTDRELMLLDFKVHFEFATTKELEQVKYYQSGILSRFERKFNQIFPSFNRKYFIEEPFSLLNDSVLIDGVYFDGYWQSEYYFRDYSEIIRTDLQYSKLLDYGNRILLNKINNSVSVSIHVRRGDYITNKGNDRIYNICSKEYYRDAINFILNKFKSPFFYIFSDDTEWVAQNLDVENSILVDINNHNPIADLLLMSACQHNIIANSSFSWWGAWLNANLDKVVVAPRVWYLDPILNQKALNSLIPKDWIII